MNTSKVAINADWKLLAGVTDTAVIISWEVAARVEIAITENSGFPIQGGHLLPKGTVVTRAMVGYGNIWARVPAGTNPAEFSLTVSVGTANEPSSPGRNAAIIEFGPDDLDPRPRYILVGTAGTLICDFDNATGIVLPVQAGYQPNSALRITGGTAENVVGFW